MSAQIYDCIVTENNKREKDTQYGTRTVITVRFPNNFEADVWSGGRDVMNQMDFAYSKTLEPGNHVEIKVSPKRNGGENYYIVCPKEFKDAYLGNGQQPYNPNTVPTGPTGPTGPGPQSDIPGPNTQPVIGHVTTYEPAPGGGAIAHKRPVTAAQPAAAPANEYPRPQATGPQATGPQATGPQGTGPQGNGEAGLYEALDGHEMSVATVQMKERHMLTKEAIALASDLVADLLLTMDEKKIPEVTADTLFNATKDLAVHLSIEVKPWKLHTQNAFPISRTKAFKAMMAEANELWTANVRTNKLRALIRTVTRKRTDSFNMITMNELQEVRQQIAIQLAEKNAQAEPNLNENQHF